MINLNQKGAAHLLVPLLLAGVGVVIYLLFSSSFPFKDKLFSTLYPKPPSFAAPKRPVSEPIASCKPRPACLDARPRCMIPEPVEGWCSKSISSPLKGLPSRTGK